MNFKKGDIIRLINRDYLAASSGSVAYVVCDSGKGHTGFLEGKQLVDVEWLRVRNGYNGQGDGEYFVTSFEKVEKDHIELYRKQFLKQGTITNLNYLASLAEDKNEI